MKTFGWLFSLSPSKTSNLWLTLSFFSIFDFPSFSWHHKPDPHFQKTLSKQGFDLKCLKRQVSCLPGEHKSHRFTHRIWFTAKAPLFAGENQHLIVARSALLTANNEGTDWLDRLLDYVADRHRPEETIWKFCSFCGLRTFKTCYICATLQKIFPLFQVTACCEGTFCVLHTMFLPR